MKATKRLGLCLIAFLLLFGLFAPAALAAGEGETDDLSLTPDEEASIASHPVVYLGVDPTFVPYEFIDSDGRYKGITADYIALISEKTGLQMAVVPGLTWAEAYDRAVNGEIDVLPCIAETAEREKYFLFSDAYFTFRRAAFINENTKGINTFADLSGKTVAVQINSSHHSYMKNFPDIQLSLYSTVESALTAVSDGRETAFVGNLATSSYLAKSEGITNLKFFAIESEGEDQSQTLHFAVRKDWPELVSILNKALGSITTEEKTAINNRWIGVEGTVDYSDILKTIGIAVLVILMILSVSYFWIIRLRREIKKRKKTEEELIAAKEEAEQANQVKSLFLARMSHEIRTPLSAITGMAYLIRKTDLSVTQSLYVDKLSQAARNMLGTINDILDFSKIEAGKIEIERISFDLDKLLQRIVNIASVKAEEQGIELAVVKAPDLPEALFGDPLRIEQILLNLTSNAVKFTEKGGVSIDIRTDGTEGAKLWVAFTVKDTGIGMNREQLDHLFVPFDQGDSTISRRFGGSGLGLSIVKSLTDLMGGEVTVVSEPGKGSAFTVRLPLEPDAKSEQRRIKNLAADCFKHMRALVVDPGDITREQLAVYFQSFGIPTDAAESGRDVPRLIRRATDEEEKPYNLIVIDFSVIMTEGLDYIQKIKNSPYSSPASKYIAILPMTREDLFDEIEAAGADFCVMKPVIPSVLYNGIIEIFNIVPPELRENADPAARPAQRQGDYSILLVEDNKTNQFIARTILEQAGLRVSIASDGEEGYRYFAEHAANIDLILMDLHMPVMDGYTSASLIRRLDEKIPIIAMTADAIAGVEEKCRSHGIYAYVSKPFEPDQLIETIFRLAKKETIETPEPVQARTDGAGALDTADGLKRVGGDEAIYRLVLREFASENSEVGKEMREKIEAEDFALAEEIAHKIKSSSGSIGAGEFHEAAAELQKSLHAGDTTRIAALHERFQVLLSGLLQTIETYLKEQ